MGQTDKTEQAEGPGESSLDDSLINLTGTIFASFEYIKSAYEPSGPSGRSLSRFP